MYLFGIKAFLGRVSTDQCPLTLNILQQLGLRLLVARGRLPHLVATRLLARDGVQRMQIELALEEGGHGPLLRLLLMQTCL